MRSLILFLNRYSNWKTLVGLIVLFVLFNAVLLKNAGEKINELAGKVMGPIDLTMGFNPQRTLQMVEDYGEAGRNYYARIEMTLDLIYPMVYALLFAVIITMIYRKLLQRPVNYLNMLPFVAMVFDYLENITIVSMLTHFPEQSMLMASLCEVFKLIKWILFAAIIFVIIVGLVRLLIRK